MAELPAGTVLGEKYRIDHLIGRGGMGSVYSGVHTDIGKHVAIKVINPKHAHNETAARRFRREARAASKIESEHVVQIFDAGRDARLGLYMVMEHLVGEDLATRLAREPPLSFEEIVEIGYQTACGLERAHAAGIIHRDLKPANIFLCSRDDGKIFAKIVDFGISKVLHTESDTVTLALTKSGAMLGTPEYMSPEQVRGGTIDHRTDVWALGCVLYEMLAGRQPFLGHKTIEKTLQAIVASQVTPLDTAAPWVPDAFADLVMQALVQAPEQRIQNCLIFAKMMLKAVGRDEEAEKLRNTQTTNGVLAPKVRWFDDVMRAERASALPPAVNERISTPPKAKSRTPRVEPKMLIQSNLRFIAVPFLLLVGLSLVYLVLTRR